MMLIRTGKLLAAILGPDDSNTCQRKLLLAVFTHVGIMVPRQDQTTATLSVVLVVPTSPAAACSRPSLASFTSLLFGKLMSSFLNGLSYVTSVLLREETVHLFHKRCKNFLTARLLASMLASTSRPTVRSGMLPSSWVITFEPFVVPPDCSNLHSNAWRNSMPPIHSYVRELAVMIAYSLFVGLRMVYTTKAAREQRSLVACLARLGRA